MGARRTTILELLQQAGGPTTAPAVAERTGLHLNTARFHLDGLVEQGYADRSSEERGTPGRPRILYEARAPHIRSYRLLSDMLAGLVAGLDHDGSAARKAGQAWGRHLVEHADPVVDRVGDSATDDALGRLDGLMEEIGFEPETRPDDAPVMNLHHCPFLEVAEDWPDVVCAVHLGLMEGALDTLDAPVQVESLQPFPAPQPCVARLQQRPGSLAGCR